MTAIFSSAPTPNEGPLVVSPPSLPSDISDFLKVPLPTDSLELSTPPEGMTDPTISAYFPSLMQSAIILLVSVGLFITTLVIKNLIYPRLETESTEEYEYRLSHGKFGFLYRFLYLPVIAFFAAGLLIVLHIGIYVIRNGETISKFMTMYAISTVVLSTLTGVLLYWLRTNFPLYYGVTEIMVAIGALWFAIVTPNYDLLPKLIGIFGGIYIIVRGFDNVDKGLPDTYRSKWDTLFKRQSNVSPDAAKGGKMIPSEISGSSDVKSAYSSNPTIS